MLYSLLASCVQPPATTEPEPEPVRPYTVDTRVDAAEDHDDPDSFGTRMCVADDGAVYLLWIDDRGSDGRYGVWMNRSLDRGETWLAAATRVDDAAGAVFNPDLACDEAGVFVVWEDDRDGDLQNHQIYFDRWPVDAPGFGTDLLLEVDPDGLSMSLEPRVVVRGQNITVVWYDDMNGAYDILSNFSVDGGRSFRADPTRVDSDPEHTYSARPKLATSEDAEQVWVAWEDSRDGATDVYFTRSDSGGLTFQEDTRLDGSDPAGASDAFEPQLCATDDRLTVVWHDARSGADHRDIYLNTSADDGDTWLAEAVRLDTDPAGSGNSLFPVCLADGADVTLAWFDDRDGDYDVWVRDVHEGVPGDPEVRLDLGDGNSLDAHIAGDDGTLVVAWQDGRNDLDENGYHDLFYSYREPGGTFLPDQDLRIDSMYDGQSFKLDLQIAVLDGELYAAWTDGRRGTSDIYFTRLEIGTGSNPPPLNE